MQLHAEIGYRILAGSRSELLQVAAQIAWTHHERHDGAGYPRRLAGEQIPLDGRIASVADVYDALTRDRVYRPRLQHAEAIRYLIAGRGTAFDPSVLDAFLARTRSARCGRRAPPPSRCASAPCTSGPWRRQAGVAAVLGGLLAVCGAAGAWSWSAAC